MAITQFFNESQLGNHSVLGFTREQASRFAKDVADDFNPLHNVDAKRFCVPGDLLFAVVLGKYGVSQRMQFVFSGMVNDDVRLVFPERAERIEINGDNGKNYLNVELRGDQSTDASLIESLTGSYVRFSGHTFPHVLIPLMQDQQVMINPDRPMVMYERMLIDLQRLDVANIALELDPANTKLQVNGKRGNVCLAFNLTADGVPIGRGEKHMLLSGLQAFEQATVDRIIADYNCWKQEYRQR